MYDFMILMSLWYISPLFEVKMVLKMLDLFLFLKIFFYIIYFILVLNNSASSGALKYQIAIY